MHRENWIKTYSGLKMYPLDPHLEEICIEDIAHALSNICRFAGHCSQFYSVAQHSINVAEHVSKARALYGLLHDASEAYLCDIPTPVKMSNAFSVYRAVESHLQSVIYTKFGLSPTVPKEVKDVDKTLLLTEARDLNLHITEGKFYKVKPLTLKMPPMTPEIAERLFMELFERIYYKRTL